MQSSSGPGILAPQGNMHQLLKKCVFDKVIIIMFVNRIPWGDLGYCTGEPRNLSKSIAMHAFSPPIPDKMYQSGQSPLSVKYLSNLSGSAKNGISIKCYIDLVVQKNISTFFFHRIKNILKMKKYVLKKNLEKNIFVFFSDVFLKKKSKHQKSITGFPL